MAVSRFNVSTFSKACRIAAQRAKHGEQMFVIFAYGIYHAVTAQMLRQSQNTLRTTDSRFSIVKRFPE